MRVVSMWSQLVVLILFGLAEFDRVNGKLIGRFDRKRVSSSGEKETESKTENTDNLKEFIEQVDSSGLLRKFLKRKMHIPEDSSLSFTSQVSRPNIFPNIFNQGEGFIVDAVVEWPLWCKPVVHHHCAF